MRGKVFNSASEAMMFRITPAYAGKSFRKLSSLFSVRDHPRLCGEKGSATETPALSLGSPPPMRGKELISAAAQNSCRITPAYAGKRLPSGNFTDTIRDHPRLCGEKRSIYSFGQSLIGSPPPMRGKVNRFRLFKNRIRITPAYAGKSYQQRNRRSEAWDHPRLCGEKPDAMASCMSS